MCLLVIKRGSWFFFGRNEIACVASVSVWFRSKERPRNGIHRFGPERNETRAKKWKVGGGGGEGRIPSFLFHPLPALLLEPFFARSLTLVPLSLLLNRTETPATQARNDTACKCPMWRQRIQSYNIILFGDCLRWPMMSFACERKSSYLRLRNVIPVCGDIWHANATLCTFTIWNVTIPEEDYFC